MRRGNGGLITGLALLAIGIVGLGLLNLWAAGVFAGAGDSGSAAIANGARIYWAGTAINGRPVPSRGGMMMGMSCAQCHGPDGRGQRTPMFASSDITYGNLTDPAGMLEPDGDRGHTYTDDLIRRAVTQGTGAAGKPLAWPMPRWQLTSEEMSDLLAYLKTLP